MRISGFVAAGVFSLLIAPAIGAQQAAAPAGGTDHVAAIEQSLHQSARALRQFQWVETTAISLKGEEKSRTQSSCYYGTDGKIQKTPIGAPPAEDRKRGVRGKVVENKTEEIGASAQEAVALVKQYVPPDPSRIQAAKDSGRLSVTAPDAKGLVAVVIKDYLKAGDSLTIEVNAANDVISSLTVATFTDAAKDAVGMKVSWKSFPDGTIYPATIHLDVAAQNLTVAIENAGYEKIGS